MAECTSTPGCPGDPAWASPNGGHWDICQHPLPYDGDPDVLEFRAHEAVTAGMAPAMTIVYLFGAAVRDATQEQRIALGVCKEMMERRESFLSIGQAILEAMGPLWAPDPDTMAAIEAINKKEG